MSEAPLPTLGLLNAFITDLSASPSYGQVLRSLDVSQHVNQVLLPLYTDGRPNFHV